MSEAMPRLGLNTDGSLDEIVGEGPYHLEQLDDDEWFLALGPVFLNLASAKPITATPIDAESWAKQPAARGKPKSVREAEADNIVAFIRRQAEGWKKNGYVGLETLVFLEALAKHIEHGEHLG